MQIFAMFILILFATACDQKSGTNENLSTEYSNPVKVQINGYSGNVMEPFISRDGSILLFNNLNAAPENTNLHWATRINDSVFQYNGEIAGVNTADLEGVPTLDNSGNLFFVSTRNYATALSTLYQAEFSNGTATNVQLVPGVWKLQAGWVNFDIEVSADGNTLYFVDGLFGQGGSPTSADLVIAEKTASRFTRKLNSNDVLKNINTGALEYAACISLINSNYISPV